MSQENVEIVRRAVAAVNARDVDGYLGFCTHDVELHTPAEAVGGAYGGADDIRRFFADIEDAGPDFRIEIRDLEPIGADCVLATMWISSTGRSSGISIESETTNVYFLTDGRINCIRVYVDRAEALEAVRAAD